MKLKRFHWALALVSIILGVMLSMQFRVTMDIRQNDAIKRMRDLSNQVALMKKKELARIKRMSGMVPLSGPGAEVLIKSSPGQDEKNNSPMLKNITDEHLLKVVNELNSAGAEAVAINGQRILTVSEIRLAGNHINVNATPVSPPYHIAAIVNGAELKSRLEIKGGIVEFLNEPGVSVEIQIKEKVEIPAYTGALDFEYAKNV